MCGLKFRAAVVHENTPFVVPHLRDVFGSVHSVPQEPWTLIYLVKFFLFPILSPAEFPILLFILLELPIPVLFSQHASYAETGGGCAVSPLPPDCSGIEFRNDLDENHCSQFDFLAQRLDVEIWITFQ